MDNSNFNIIYESLLNEVNAGIYSSKEIKQLKDVALSKWNILLNKLESYKGSKLNIVLNDNLINEFKDGICDIISFGGCDWNIVYNFEFLDESFLNPAYIGAKFNPGEYLIGFLTSGNIINSTSYKQDLIEHKKNFNKNNSCKFTLSININVDVDKLFSEKSKIDGFALHESSHLYDYLIHRDKTYNTMVKYSEISKKINMGLPYDDTELKNYFVDVEFNAQLSSVMSQLERFKKKIVPSKDNFSLYLNRCDNWNFMRRYLVSKDKLKKKTLNKLLFFWLNKDV